MSKNIAPTAEEVLRGLAGVLAVASNKPTQQTTDVRIKHEGKAIVLPADPAHMHPKEAAEHLLRLAELDEKKIKPNEIIKAFPFDGAVAFMKAMQRTFGWATPQPTPGWFGSSNPPQTISVETGVNSTVNVFWGRFTLPGLEDGYLETGIHHSEDGEVFFRITGEIRRKYSKVIEELADTTRAIVREESIYRGKALRVRVNTEGDANMEAAPGFIDITAKETLILPDLVAASVEANMFTPVRHAEYCKKIGVPLKRGILLSGVPGTGKSLTAAKLAQTCVENNWTFILVPRCKSLSEVMRFAVRYQPAVVFAEDIDRITSGARDEQLDELLNTLDGVNTKTAEVMTVLTTNNLNGIERTVVRPGRIDAIVEFPAPDSPTIERFIHHYGKGLIAANAKLDAVCLALEGTIPANVRECVERAKLYALASGATPENMVITGENLLAAATAMRPHIEFFHSKRVDATSPGDRLATAIREIVAGVDIEAQLDSAVAHSAEAVNQIARHRKETE